MRPSFAAVVFGARPLLATAHAGVDRAKRQEAAMAAVSLRSALVARRRHDMLCAPTGFAAMLLIGALAGLTGVQMPDVEPMISVSLMAIGLLVAIRMRLPGPVAAAVVGTFAVFHGVAHGDVGVALLAPLA
ncbi:MAG: HupE/UreJ family protein [Janthinobacterium lividum]